MIDSRPKKELGQHWLQNDAVLNDIVAEAKLAPTDTVLEIGPGQGVLTAKLLTKADRVIAVELDEILAEGLIENLKQFNAGEDAHQKLTIIKEDIRVFDLEQLPPDYKVVANIPYYLSSFLLEKLSESLNPPTQATLLVQKEVAQRVGARAGNMSILSISVQVFWNVKLGREVGPENFYPAPSVDSQVLHLIRRKQPLFDVEMKPFMRIVKAGFSEKRKMLSNSLAGGLGATKEEVTVSLMSIGVNPMSRAQELDLSQWFKIYTKFKD